MGAVLSMECEYARARASLALDGELSQVERAHLRAHVERCTGCAAYARDLDGLTQELRSAPLQRPRGRAPARRRRPGARRLQLGLVAAVVALAAGLGSLAGSLTTSSLTHGGSPPPSVPGSQLPLRTPV
ncbi:MAG TPA: zf-HC2 domain-containing protein [Gaiellaceae bacterium]|jgi:predicted anti-sigma-YlaC factor YlaD